MTSTTSHECGRIACPDCGGSGFCEGEESGSRCTGLCGQTGALGRTAYRVVRGHHDKVPYFLIGARCALYGLMRNGPRPERLFRINARHFTKRSRDVWFTDKDRELAML